LDTSSARRAIFSSYLSHFQDDIVDDFETCCVFRLLLRGVNGV
jgi:hypothetical protein